MLTPSLLLFATLLTSVVSGPAAATEAGRSQEQSASQDWRLQSNEDGVSTWSLDIPGSPVVAFRGETVMDFSLPKIAGVLDDTTRQLEWVSNAMEAKDLDVVSRSERIIYNCTRTPWPLANRDFVFRTSIEADKPSQTLIVKMKSEDDPRFPPRNDRVRGWIQNSQYTLTALDGGKRTRVRVEIHADPKGAVPKWIVNLFQKTWPRVTLDGIKRQAAKADVAEIAEIRDYFFGTPPPAGGTIHAAAEPNPAPTAASIPADSDRIRTSQAAPSPLPK